jgi:sortase (surface protein transpeptidase)
MLLLTQGVSNVRRSLVALILAALAAIPFGARPAHASQVLTLPKGWPQRLIIPSIGIAAPVESLAFTRAADAGAPYKWGDVAWYDRGPKPGDLGRANIFGHLDSTCCPAVFYRLKDLKPGDTLQVAYKHGRPLVFRVLWQATYPNNKIPLNFLFGQVNERGLVLMTCTGVFHRDGTGYDHKLVVYARLVLPNGKLG